MVLGPDFKYRRRSGRWGRLGSGAAGKALACGQGRGEALRPEPVCDGESQGAASSGESLNSLESETGLDR